MISVYESTKTNISECNSFPTSRSGRLLMRYENSLLYRGGRVAYSYAKSFFSCKVLCVRYITIQAGNTDKLTLANTTWNCKYHIVFAPKYRRQIIYRKYKFEIGKILRTLCERKCINIIKAQLCPDHIHMFPPKYSVSQIMGYLKGKSSLMMLP